VFTESTEYTPKAGGYPTQSAPAFPNGYVQSTPDDLVWASGYAVLALPSSGPATATYYQVQFNGDVSQATSQLLWSESIPGPS
jgi:hypothetical protein